MRAYLEIESLRLGDRLILEQAIDPGLAEALIPPFSLQPLVENAVQHGLQSSSKAGCVQLTVRRRIGEWLDMTVSDDGAGVPATEIEQIFFADGEGRLHLQHSGAFALGAATAVLLVPSAHLGVVVLTNAYPIGVAEGVAFTFTDIALYGKATQDWLALFKKLFSNPAALGVFWERTIQNCPRHSHLHCP